MSYYTKSKIWENINSNINSMANNVASLKQSFDYGKQYDMNREFDNRYEDYQKVVDYADANAYTKYDSIDSFINSASADLNIDSKFIKNVIESNNYDPTMSNGATMTSWMLKNGTGSTKWNRNQITKALNKIDETTVQDLLVSGLVTYAQELVSKDPYSMYDWEPSLNKKYTELLDPKSISEATGIDERRVQDILNNSSIKENVDKIYNTELRGYFEGLKEQQEKARIKQAAGTYLTSVIDQCVANNTSTEEFKNLLDESIIESGLNLTESPEILERYRYEAYESYIAKKSIEFGKENFLLDDYEFHEKFVEYNTGLRKEVYGTEDSKVNYMVNYADAYTSKVESETSYNETLSKEIDTANDDYIKNVNNIITVNLSNINSNIDENNELSVSYSEKYSDIDSFVSDIVKDENGNSIFSSIDELADWCIKNNKIELYKNVRTTYAKIKKEDESIKQSINNEIANLEKERNNYIQTTISINLDNINANIGENDNLSISYSSKYESLDSFVADILRDEEGNSLFNSLDEFANWAIKNNKEDLYKKLRETYNKIKNTEKSVIDEEQKKIDTETTNLKNQYYNSIEILSKDIVNQLENNPYLIINNDFSNDGIAKLLGYESYQALVDTNDIKLFGYYDDIFNQVIKAKSTIESQNSALEKSLKEYNDAEKKQFEEAFSRNCTNLINQAKTNQNTIYSIDYIANDCSNKLFSTADELIDNGSWVVIDDFIKTCTEIAKISANNFSSNIDEQYTADYVRNRRENFDGSSIKIANYSTSDYSVSVEIGERTSKNDDKFALLNEDVVKTNKTVVNPYYTFNPYQDLTDWTLIDELSKDKNFQEGLKVIDYDGFVEYLNTIDNEDLKKDPYFVQALIIQWNGSYTNVPTTEENQEMLFETQLASANQMILDGNYTEGIQALNNLSATAPPDKIGEINTATSQAKTLIKNQTEFEQVNEIINNVIEGYKFGGDNKYYNILKSNATDNFNISYRYAEELKNGTKTIEQVTEEIYSLYAQKNYDESMKQLEKNIKKSSGFVDFISGQDMNLFTSDFKLNYQKINEGTMYNMTDTEVKNFNSWLINQINGKEVKLEDINSTLFSISSDGNKKITYNGKEYKEGNKENPVYTKSLMIKGTLDYIAGKTKYLKDLLINANYLKEEDISLINFKSDDGSYYDIGVYEENTGYIYLMPNDNSVNDILCLLIQNEFKEELDNNIKGKTLTTVSKYMTFPTTINLDFSKYLSSEKDNIKQKTNFVSKIISNLFRPLPTSIQSN